jgi:hypothetical protein
VASRPSGAELEVSIVGDVPVSWIDTQEARDAIDGWVGDQYDSMTSAARAVEDTRTGRRNVKGTGVSATSLENPMWAQLERSQQLAARQIAGALGSFQAAGLLGKPDERTFEEFVTLMDDWRERMTSSAFGALPFHYFDAGHGAVRLQVTNLGGRFLTDLQVDVEVEWDTVTILDEFPSEPAELPHPPRPFGQASPPVTISPVGLSASLLRSPYPPLWNETKTVRRTRVDQGTGQITFHVGNLRQGSVQQSEPCFLLATARPESGIVRETWTATIRDPDEVLTGSFDLAVADDGVAIVPLLEAGARDEDTDGDR